MSLPGPIELALQIADLLDRLDIPYVIGGSLASSLQGEPRATLDVDIALRMHASDIDRLVASLGPDFYVSREAAREAVAQTRSFNLIHLETTFKVDLFVLGKSLLDQEQLRRRVRIAVSESPRRELWVSSPEDVILRKLEWFEAGGRVSDRQWRDVLGVLAAQVERLDRSYLERAAADLGLTDLLERARAELAQLE